MKKKHILVASFSLFLSLFPRTLVNEILVVIHHEMGTATVLASDVRPGLDGRMQTLREVVLNRLMQFDAEYHRVIVTPEEAEQYIENIQKQNRLSRKAVEDLFSQAGYTYAEAREYLRARQMIEQVIEFRVKSDKRMLISRADAQAQYDKNPPKTQARYTLAIAFIPQDKLGKKSVDGYIKDVGIDSITFDEPFELEESEIAPDRKSLTTRAEGDIVFTEEVEGGVEITRLLKKVPAGIKPFDECYNELVVAMRKERLKEIFDEYHALLFSQATFTFTHPEDAKILQAEE